VSKQYQKQKEKWFEKGKQQTLKNELKFLKKIRRNVDDTRIYERIIQIEKELGVKE